MKNLSNVTEREGAAGFNYNKLQAVACIVGSAAVSIALIYWAAQHLLG